MYVIKTVLFVFKEDNDQPKFQKPRPSGEKVETGRGGSRAAMPVEALFPYGVWQLTHSGRFILKLHNLPLHFTQIVFCKH